MAVDTPPMLSSLVPPPVQQNRPVLSLQQTVETVSERVVVRPAPVIRTFDEGGARGEVVSAHRRTDLATATQNWGWEELRDYVVSQIEAVVGVFPRTPHKERAIFAGFLKRWPEQGPQIARYAFEVAGGYWKNAPISVNRFCERSDPYFAKVIADHLADVSRARAAQR